MSEWIINDRDTLSNHLDNLLAVIHRDGGHYQGEHGTDEAVADGMLIVSNLIAERDALKADLATMTADRDQYQKEAIDYCKAADKYCDSYDALKAELADALRRETMAIESQHELETEILKLKELANLDELKAHVKIMRLRNALENVREIVYEATDVKL